MIIRTTLTLAYGRVASQGDFLALGEGVHKTPGWTHLEVSWEVGREVEARVTPTPARELTGQERGAIARHLRAYVNLHFPGLAS